MIWIVLFFITILALILLLLPFRKNGLNKAAVQSEGIDVYKAQLIELEADLTRGVLSDADAEPLRLEIQRRILRAGRTQKSQTIQQKSQTTLVIAIAIAVVAGSFSLYFMTGSPDVPSKPLASRDLEKEKRDLAGQDLNSLVKRLAEKLQENPDNLDGWILLARTLSRMERYEDSANTYLQATRLAPNDADLYVGAAENYYYMASGSVSDAALQNFKKAYSLDPLHPGARYYLAVHDAQNGKLGDALDKWISLYQDSEADAPFMPLLSERITRSAAELDRDVAQILAQKQPITNEPGPSREDMEAAAEMTAADRREMIENMVAGLAERMLETPEFDGLMRLGKAYATQQKFEESANAYERAAQLQPENVDPLVLQALSLVRASDNKEPPQTAIEVYRKVLVLDDTVAEAHWYIGVSEAIQGNTDQARTHWQRMLELIPQDSALYTNVINAIKSLSPTPQN